MIVLLDMTFSSHTSLLFNPCLSPGQRNDLAHVFISRLADQPAQESILVVDQGKRSIVLLDFSFFQHQNLVIVDDGVQPVGDRDDSCLR